MLSGPVSTLPANPSPTQVRRFPLAGALLLGLFVVAFVGNRADGQPPPIDGNDLARINVAVSRGQLYLQRSQNPDGSRGEKDHLVGTTALCGLALVECGVPKNNPGLLRARQFVRDRTAKLDNTYEVSFVVLFLDRMNVSEDRQLIQRLAVRLVAGQTQTGGWSYKVPIPDPNDSAAILSGLRRMSPNVGAAGPSFRDRPSSLGLCIKMSDDIRPKPSDATKEISDPETLRKEVLKTLPRGFTRLPVFMNPNQLGVDDPEGKAQEPLNGTTDNSTTHLATVALWACRKYDVPTDRSFALLNRRFRGSQNKDGSWGYKYADGGGVGGTPQMTSVALLNLAIGFVLNLDQDAPPRLEQDPQVLAALKSLGRHVGQPAGSFENRPAPQQSGGLYYFWAMERIAVLYDLRTLDNKDWYRWGAEILVCHQAQDGSWEKGGYPGESPVRNTAFGLLFLKRANLTPDLSRRLVVDSSTLTEKVTPTEPVPMPKVEPSVPTMPDPEPEPKIEQPTQPEVPTTTTPAPNPAVTESSPSTPKVESDRPLWPWLLGLLVVLVGGGGVLFAALKKSKDEDDEDEKPKKKKKKKKG